MCPTIVTSGDDSSYEWRQESINGGSLRRVDLETGSNSWASPPANLFSLRSSQYFSHNEKTPSGDFLLLPAGVDWLRSPHRLDNFLSHPNNSIVASQSVRSFIIAINLQIPSREHHSAIFYFAADDPIPVGSVLHRFIHGDDAFRNSRFKMVNRIVKGPWIFKAAMGKYGVCMLGKALECRYHKGENYLEIDVDIGSSAVASAVLKLTMGYVKAVTIDMGFLVEAQSEEELPEKLIGAVRIAQMEISAAKFVEPVKKGR